MAEEAGHAVWFNDHSVPAASQRPGGHLHSEDAAHSNHILIQTRHLLATAEVIELRERHVQICRSLAHNTYLCRYEPADLEAVRQMPYVLYTNVLHKDLKINSHLEERLSHAESPTYKVSVVLHDRPDRHAPQLMEYMTNAMGVPRDQIWLNGHNLRAVLRPTDIQQLAHLDEVMAIEEVPEYEGFNNLARGILGLTSSTPSISTSSSNSGSSSSSSSSSTVYDGSGEIIVVADSGFDTGPAEKDGKYDATTYHPAFKNRVLLLQPFSTRGNDTRDLAGHGTHVCGSAVGAGNAVSADGTLPFADQLTGPVCGTAPGADLIVQAIWGLPNFNPTWNDIPIIGTDGKPLVKGGKPELEDGVTVLDLFQQAYKLPGSPRIHNNSWGKPNGGSQAGYDDDTGAIDDFIRRNPDFLIVRAAGNDGDSAYSSEPQIMTSTLAKNGLTIGACFSDRQVNVQEDQGLPINQLYYPAMGGQVKSNTYIPKFSSRGPGQGSPGLIKPDLVAPGAVIYSTNSQARQTVSSYGVSPDKYFAFLSGTSQAAPLVSGCAAVLRQALRGRMNYQDSAQPPDGPSAALIKALLVNNADDLKGGKLAAGGPAISGMGLRDMFSGKGGTESDLAAAPNCVQGWGRVNLAESLRNVCQPTNTFVHDAKAGDDVLSLSSLGKKFTVEIDPKTDQVATFKVTMAYPDWPGAALHNVVWMSLNFPDLPKDQRRIGAKSQPYAGNNVQRYIRTNITSTLKIEVIVFANTFQEDPKNPGGGFPPQPFALVWMVTYANKEEEKKGNE